MSIVSILTDAVSAIIPVATGFHPAFKVVKVADGQYDFSWSVLAAAGTYHLSLSFEGSQFVIKGDAAVIPSDSVFPFNVLAPVINGFLGKAIEGGLDAVSGPPVKLGMSKLGVGTHEKLMAILEAPVGTAIEVPAADGK